MSEFTTEFSRARFESSHLDLVDEIRLMALAEQEGAQRDAAHRVPDAPRSSLLRRLFTRPATRLAA